MHMRESIVNGGSLLRGHGGGETLKHTKYSQGPFPLEVSFSVLSPFSLFMNF